MNIDYLGKCAIRQHRATLAVAQQLVGLPYPLIHSLPFLAKRKNELWLYAPFRSKIDFDFVNPYIMNGSFSLELRMKYLHALETGIALPQGHRLRTIFEGLTIECRSAIRANFHEAAKANSSSKEISRVFNEKAKLQFKWDIDLFLEKSNLAFERWRYIYEHGADST